MRQNKKTNKRYALPPRSPIGLVCMLALSFVVLLAAAAVSASAAMVMHRPLIKTFDGSDTTAGKFQFDYPLENIAVDESSGAVYVLEYRDEGGGLLPFLHRFNAAGEAQNWSATGTSSLPLSPFFHKGGTYNQVNGIAVDNSNVNAGRIILVGPFNTKAWSPSGEFLWEFEPPIVSCGAAVDAEGHLWIPAANSPLISEYASTGSPPAQIGELALPAGGDGCDIAFDKQEDLYLGQAEGGVAKYVDQTLSAIIDPFASKGIAIDQSKVGGHIVIGHSGNFTEYDSTGMPIWNFGEGLNGETSIGADSSRIAYNYALDRVYVLSGQFEKKVFVFGPPEVVGTAPDLTINPTTSDSLDTAHISGTVNPLDTENSYHFEYKADNKSAWISGVVSTTVEHITPSDSAAHAVSADLTGLEPFTQYQARLVATNDETGVKNVSKVDLFRTGQPAVVTIGSPGSATVHTVEIAGTVDPKDTDATWRFQTSVDPQCLSGIGFEDHLAATIAANSGVTSVEDELTGLAPDQEYCVRLAATNSPGTATSEIKQFTTVAVPPAVEPRGAAPRVETGARLNAFVNPENAATTYRFEVSEDGGASWNSREDHFIAVGNTRAVFVSEEIGGLEPGGTYSFRISAESDGGVVGSDEQSFRTLMAPTTCPNQDVRVAQRAAYLGACRGIELVNEPDKGNQNVYSEPPRVGSQPISEDGSKVIWRVLGGAPGAPNGSEGTFLAQRSTDGWRSQSIVPATEQQFGNGELTYFLNGITPDFESFVFAARLSTALASPAPPTVVRIRNGEQDVLKSYATQSPAMDLSDNGAHVLFVDAQTNQLEDIGGARIGPPTIPAEAVSVMPDGAVAECGLDVFPASGNRHDYHWIATSDASRVFFFAKPNVDEPGGGSCAGADHHLYVRNRDAGTTSLVGSGGFIRSSVDGREAYFLSTEALDAVDNDSGRDIYRWEEAAGKSTCVTCVAEAAANVTGDVWVSDDFSHVYFTSKQELVEGMGVPGELNLYSLSAGQVRFVAVVDEVALSSEDSDARPEVSHDGEVLVFEATVGPETTADAIAPKCAFSLGGTGSCNEIYRYDDRDHSVECLSCDHSGTTTHSAGSPYGQIFDFRVSADGQTVAFATAEGLLPSDVNGGVDIYEWRVGAVHLITDGVGSYQRGPSAPRVIAVDGDGDNVLFALVPPNGGLTGFEADHVGNLYDARIGGGFEPPSTSEPCNEDACQGPLQKPPAAAPPATTGFSGRGNSRGRSCAPRKVRRSGRCVKRGHKQRHHRRGRAHRGKGGVK